MLRFSFSRLSSAFTLVELMVVVAIIAALVMLAIPNIRNMREKAWSTQCQNNLRQYGVAMGQYMSAGSEASGAGAGGKFGINLPASYYTGGIWARNASAASATVGPPIFYNIVGRLPMDVTIQSLSAGQASVRVCPVVLQMIKKQGNFFDPNSPNFKGNGEYEDTSGNTFVRADFEGGWISSTNPLNTGDTNSGYDEAGSLILSAFFSTYAINPRYGGGNWYIKDIPANVIAYIDWNAKEGWNASLNPHPSGTFKFTSPDNRIVCNVTPKWTNAWWLTEVGFYHLQGGEYGANYVAMDGHVGWVSSNAIGTNLFY
ncbi:MAG: type II secretion system protein [Kiritimatiellia bacterium]